MNNVSSPLTVAVVRRAKRGCEEAFEAALHVLIQQSLEEPGQLGVHVLKPVKGSNSRDYGILRRFADEASRDAFYASPLYQAWVKQSAELTEANRHYEEVSGLETWFALPGAPALATPPRWKMAIMTLLGVYPSSLLIPALLQPVIGELPLPLRALAIASGMVAALTWLIMPTLAKILHPWLHPKPR